MDYRHELPSTKTSSQLSDETESEGENSKKLEHDQNITIAIILR